MALGVAFLPAREVRSHLRTQVAQSGDRGRATVQDLGRKALPAAEVLGHVGFRSEEPDRRACPAALLALCVSCGLSLFGLLEPVDNLLKPIRVQRRIAADREVRQAEPQEGREGLRIAGTFGQSPSNQLHAALFLLRPQGGAWADAELDITIEGKVSDALRSFTWIGVSPDDRWVVVPLRDADSGAYELVVIDATDGSHRSVINAKGPVGFTADARTIVSYDRATPAQPPGTPEAVSAAHTDGLLFIDAKSLRTRRIEIPATQGFQFHVSGSLVAVAPSGLEDPSADHPPLLVIDANAPDDRGTTVPGDLHLSAFSERRAQQELWVISHERLHRVDLRARTREWIALPFTPEHLNYLPDRDWIVVDEPAEDGSTTIEGLVFIDADSGKIVRRVRVPVD